MTPCLVLSVISLNSTTTPSSRSSARLELQMLVGMPHDVPGAKAERALDRFLAGLFS
jgi:hypothetical protein